MNKSMRNAKQHGHGGDASKPGHGQQTGNILKIFGSHYLHRENPHKLHSPWMDLRRGVGGSGGKRAEERSEWMKWRTTTP